MLLNPRGDYAALGDVAEIRPVGLQAIVSDALTFFCFVFFGGEGCLLLVLPPVDWIGAENKLLERGFQRVKNTWLNTPKGKW